MMHPWYLDEGWQKKAAKYNVTQGTPQWQYYVETVYTAKKNSFKVPCLAGFIILGLFAFVVFVGALRNALLILLNRSSIASNSSLFRKNISQAPLFKHRHSKVYKLIGNFVTIQAPLRGETLLLLALFLANLIPLVAFYTPYTVNNVYYPNDVFFQVGRYVSDRSAILAISQLPIVILLSGRNNPVAFMTRASFATCMLFHRWVARLITVQVLIHAIAQSTIKTHQLGNVAGLRKLFHNSYVSWGLAACISLVFLCFFSLRWFRQRSYEWFVITHIILAIAVIIGTFYHIKLLDKDALYADFINFVYVSIAFWSFDKAVRVLRLLYLNAVWSRDGGFCHSKGVVALLHGTEDILSISLHLTGRGARRWLQDPNRATSGLTIQLWIPRVQPLSSHPFTVASIEDNGDTLRIQLYVQVKKGITSRLLGKVHQMGGPCELSTMVEGFYRQQIQSPISHNQVYVAGGIGITSSISYLHDAVRLGIEAHLLWLTPNSDMIAIASDDLKRLAISSKIEKESKEFPCRQTISIYITRPQPPSIPLFEKNSTQTSMVTLSKFDDEKKSSCCSNRDVNDTIDQLNSLHPLLDVHLYSMNSRPELCELVLPLIRPGQTTLLCCGPAGLLDAARDISRHHDIDYHQEAFAW